MACLCVRSPPSFEQACPADWSAPLIVTLLSECGGTIPAIRLGSPRADSEISLVSLPVKRTQQGVDPVGGSRREGPSLAPHALVNFVINPLRKGRECLACGKPL